MNNNLLIHTCMYMTRINFFIPKKILEKLKKVSKETGAPYSELIRRAINSFLKAQKEHK